MGKRLSERPDLPAFRAFCASIGLGVSSPGSSPRPMGRSRRRGGSDIRYSAAVSRLAPRFSLGHPSGNKPRAPSRRLLVLGPRAPAPDRLGHGTVPDQGTKAERQAARERVSAYHQAELAELLTNVVAAVDRYRAGEVDACTLDEMIHHYHRAAGELWKFCFSGGGGSHAEFIAGVLDRMAADAETIDWWERATPQRCR